MGIHLTLDDLRRVQQVLETDTAWTPTRLRQVLLVLLAKNAQQREDFERLYQQFQQAEDGDATQQAVDIARLQQDLQQLVAQFEQQREQPKTVQPQLVDAQEEAGSGRFWWIVTLLIAGVFIGTLVLLTHLNKPASQQLVSKPTTTTTALPTVDSTPSPVLPLHPCGEGSG
ncbi:hypothetical protein [Candidatus Thiothrix anitrata]|uniref:Uncharacterized protein n=1 Tax=Candidatus Thiothrix anitrata TaxID=2823902 RepID=A0ABX7X2C7_9GAMM|nr:hypothetical protein [Candidatus Thiothrix anitrata]QTR49756.1 hypothetical protein J8380_16240 [Candidatus Thiothrix anitrata]